MRPKTLNFEQLVDLNRQELLNDEKRISQIEEKLEKKQEAFRVIKKLTTIVRAPYYSGFLVPKKRLHRNIFAVTRQRYPISLKAYP